jgi:MarR family 2-MHQ and catechol resistance regulon transcriptional repressor
VDRAELNERAYRCLQEISVLLDDGDRGVMRDVGLSPAHFQLLRLLEQGPNATGRTITRLAELTLCTRGNVTRVVQRLVEAGLVEIRSDRSDQRLVRVFLTELGANRLAAAEQAHARLNADRLGEFADEEIIDLLSHLTALTQRLRKHLAEG